MGSHQILSTRWIALAALAVTFAAVSGATTVTYSASGTFSLISGADTFQLSTRPFSFTITAAEGVLPTATGPTWAEYKGLAVKATVQSGITPSPITISNNNAGVVLAASSSLDFFTMGTGVKVVGLPIGILAKIAMAKGTLTNTQILPFTHGVTLSPTNATVKYSSTVNGVEESTLLGITGTFFTVVSATATTASSTLMLHSAGAEAVTSHGDGTRSVRPVSASPVSLGATADKVTLRFYASGVRDASEVHVQIGGEDVPVLYTGPAGHFAGLDEITVQIPRSLAGRGQVDVTLTADGQKANSVRVNIE